MVPHNLRGLYYLHQPEGACIALGWLFGGCGELWGMGGATSNRAVLDGRGGVYLTKVLDDVDLLTEVVHGRGDVIYDRKEGDAGHGVFCLFVKAKHIGDILSIGA